MESKSHGLHFKMNYLSKAYTTTELSTLLNLPVRKVITFEERGYIYPSIERAAGHGSKRLWSFEDVARCFMLKDLIEVVSVAAIRRIMEEIHGEEYLFCFGSSFIDIPLQLYRQQAARQIERYKLDQV